MTTGHTCHAHGCDTSVPPSMFVCRRHWRALRPELRRAIWREYKAGQEVTKTPSLRYMAVQRRAVAELVFKPYDEAAAAAAVPYLLAAERFRRLAIEAGHGDPLASLVPAGATT